MSNPQLVALSRRSKLIVVLFVGLALAPLWLKGMGPTHTEKAFDTVADPQISLTNLQGQIVIRGWDRSQVHAVCNTASPRVEIDTETMPREGKAERLYITAHPMDRAVSSSDEVTDCTLDVPLASSLEIHNRQGGVVISHLEGQHARIESADAKISASDIAGHLTARSLGGDIDIVRPSGRVEAYSITGNLSFTDPTSKDLRGNTNSGRIIYHGDFMPAGEYVFSTYSGNIEIIPPASASFELSAKTLKGKVENAFSLKPKKHYAPPFPSAQSLLGTHSTGNATVELTSFSGHIRIHPQP